MELRAPVRMDVPYGGRLVWTMPGDNRLFVHLKDKSKCRNKKRWSQVMYMYYLLGHRIMETISDVNRKQALADNTYILAIDGDSKFSPAAVQKLVDLMRKHVRLGSACGRIHPIGAGIMVWYQKFEYAIAHWFQKATEHVFGCVLCSPGCFSLFRASALMDDNVMHKYTKLASQPRHYVQYDQGEDRWLSTLLLKQGYRIEYAAAADAETYAPEGFDEFFNQRRRWTPSSIANTLDLLADYKRAIENNDSISWMYILYQMIVILFSMVGPAIIFTMMIFAQVAAFHITAWTALWANLIPVTLFTCVCFIASSSAQLALAKFLSIGYAFIMMAVLVGTGIQIAAEGIASPTSIYVLTLVTVFSSSALFHPQEFTNVFYGTVFFLMIPSTYVILSLYSLINLNVINWGTREAIARALGDDASLTPLQRWMQKLPFVRKRKSGGGSSAEGGDVGSRFMCGCDRLCQCLCCPEEDLQTKTRNHLTSIDAERFMWLNERLTRIDEKLHAGVGGGGVSSDTVTPPQRAISNSPALMGFSTPLSGHNGVGSGGGDDRLVDISPVAVPQINVIASSPPAPCAPASLGLQRRAGGAVPMQLDSEQLAAPTPVGVPADESADDDDMNLSMDDESSVSDAGSQRSVGGRPILRRQGGNAREVLHGSAWMHSSYLGRGTIDVLDEVEYQFWSDFVETYLKPIHKTKQEEAEAVVGLRELRNKIAFGLLLINGLLVLIIYLLQLNKRLLSFDFQPYENYTWNKYDPDSGGYKLVQEPLKIEPIGFTIILFLSLILIIQTVGMLLHRWHTLSHVLASTELVAFRQRRGGNSHGDDMLEENAIQIARALQRLQHSDELGVDGGHVGTATGGGQAAVATGRTGNRRRRAVVVDLERAQKRKKKTRGLKASFERRFFALTANNRRQQQRVGSSAGRPTLVRARPNAEAIAHDSVSHGLVHYSPFVDHTRASILTADAIVRRREQLEQGGQVIEQRDEPTYGVASSVNSDFMRRLTGGETYAHFSD